MRRFNANNNINNNNNNLLIHKQQQEQQQQQLCDNRVRVSCAFFGARVF